MITRIHYFNIFERRPSVKLVMECISNTKSISHTISATIGQASNKREFQGMNCKHFFHRKYKLYHTLAMVEYVVYHMINAQRWLSTPCHIQSKSLLVVLVKRSERPEVKPPLWAWLLAF